MALGFATLAVEGASEVDQLWIDSLYHQIYCATAAPVRKRAAVIADRYRKDVRIVEAIRDAQRKTAIGKITEVEEAEGWGRSLTWVCANGEPVVWPKRSRPQPADGRGANGGDAAGAYDREAGSNRR